MRTIVQLLEALVLLQCFKMVYLYCCSERISGYARHYLGQCEDWRLRLRDQEHQNGSANGARILQVALEQGISFSIVRGWPKGDKALERRLKWNGHIDKLCPCCNPEGWETRGVFQYTRVSDEDLEKTWFNYKSNKKAREGR